MRYIHWATNRNVVLSCAIVGGLIVGPTARFLEPATLPALMIVMTVSTMRIPSRQFLQGRALLRSTLVALAASYLGVGLVFLGFSRLLAFPDYLWVGFVLIGIAPPAIAVIPFADALGGDTRTALLAVLGSYLVALVLVPLLSAALLQNSLVSPSRVFTPLVFLIGVPLVLSRLLAKMPGKEYVERWRGAIANWCFFVITLTAIGLNRDLMLGRPVILAQVVAVAAAGTFGVGIVLQYLLARLRVERSFSYLLVLLATIKNGGLAIAVALASFSESATYAPAVVIICSILFYLWLGRGQRTGPHQGR